MSFDTDKNKLRSVFEKNNTDTFNLEIATLKQNNKEKAIAFSKSNDSNLKVNRAVNSEWIALELKVPPTYVDPGGSNEAYGAVQAADFTVSMTLPEYLIPYARLNLAVKSIGAFNEDIIMESYGNAGQTTITQFSSVEGINGSNYLKKVTWYLSISILRGYNTKVYDAEVKFYFTLLNPS